MIEFLNCDCMEYMRTLPDKAFDLAIVDVNYGIKEDGRNNHTRSNLCKASDYSKNARYDNDSPDQQYFSELFRVSKNQIVFGANHFISKIPVDSPCWIVWDKNNGENDFADCELAWTSFSTAVRKFRWTWAGMLQQNMKNKQKRIHPNEKPVQLYQWLYDNYAKQGNKILDTHGGSMSHAIAADMEGYDLVIMEKDKDYFDAAVKRFNQYKQQTKLFS